MVNTDDSTYPVPGRTPELNRRISTHESGHALLARCLGSTVHLVTIVPGDGFAGRCVRSGAPSNFDFDDDLEAQTSEILTVCEQLARMGPMLGSSRVADAEMYVRAQTTMIELVGGQVAETILHPDIPPLGAIHDFVEAKALAGVACAASPAVAALLAYAESEAHALLSDNADILRDLVDALVERGTLSGSEVDTIIEHRIALRSIAAEHQRRDDWRRRTLDAARFLGGKVVIGPPGSRPVQQSEGEQDQQRC